MGIKYPPSLIFAGEKDDIVPAMHSCKMAAYLQSATGGGEASGNVNLHERCWPLHEYFSRAGKASDFEEVVVGDKGFGVERRRILSVSGVCSLKVKVNTDNAVARLALPSKYFVFPWAVASDC